MQISGFVSTLLLSAYTVAFGVHLLKKKNRPAGFTMFTIAAIAMGISVVMTI